LLHDLLEDIEQSSIEEVWDVNFINTSKHHFVLVLSGGVHFSTCMLVSTVGVICRHYWKVLLESTVASFHIAIVPERWYRDDIVSSKNPWGEAAIQVTNSSAQPSPSPSPSPSAALALWQQPQYKKNTSEEMVAKQLISQKVAYGMLHGECKHLINLALEESYNLHSILAQVKTEILAKREARLAQLASKKTAVSSHAYKQHGNVQLECSDESDKENNSFQDVLDNIQNPAVVVSKGRPRSSRLKSATEGGKRGQQGCKVPLTASNELNANQENNGIKRKRTECQYCKALNLGDERFGHNQAGCKRKKADLISKK
jgi:hypothetical protein